MEGRAVVIAVSIVITETEYAFSLFSTPRDIKINKSWVSRVGCRTSVVPTSVLINPQEQFEAFRYDAEEKYHVFKASEEAAKEPWDLYKNMNMQLKKTKVKEH